MLRLTNAEKRRHQRGLIAAAFRTEYLKRYAFLAEVFVYEASAAANWVVTTSAQDHIAWVADGSLDEFVFWGPLGRRPIVFQVPQGWPA
jgi:hypothetical protein